MPTWNLRPQLVSGHGRWGPPSVAFSPVRWPRVREATSTSFGVANKKICDGIGKAEKKAIMFVNHDGGGGAAEVVRVNTTDTIPIANWRAFISGHLPLIRMCNLGDCVKISITFQTSAVIFIISGILPMVSLVLAFEMDDIYGSASRLTVPMSSPVRAPTRAPVRSPVRPPTPENEEECFATSPSDSSFANC
jgi:hypothetical protein